MRHLGLRELGSHMMLNEEHVDCTEEIHAACALFRDKAGPRRCAAPHLASVCSLAAR